MDQTQILNINILLDYLYNKFFITLLMCIIGLLIKEFSSNSTDNNGHKFISIKRMVIGGIFSTVLMCALITFIQIPFALYVLICVIVGIWSDRIIKLLTNVKIFGIFIKGIGAFAKGGLSGAIEKTVDDISKLDSEIDEVSEEESKDKDIKSENNKSKDDDNKP